MGEQKVFLYSQFGCLHLTPEHQSKHRNSQDYLCIVVTFPSLQKQHLSIVHTTCFAQSSQKHFSLDTPFKSSFNQSHISTSRCTQNRLVKKKWPAIRLNSYKTEMNKTDQIFMRLSPCPPKNWRCHIHHYGHII